MFRKNQNTKKAFYPRMGISTFDVELKPMEKQDGEIRIISMDIALKQGNSNDNTAYICMSLIPTKSEGYHRNILYIQTYNGVNSVVQAKRAKELFYDFQADYFVMDMRNAGNSIYDILTMDNIEDDYGGFFPPWIITKHETIDKKVYDDNYSRALSKENAEAVVYPISATAQFNDEIAKLLRDKLQRRLMSFLISENDADEFLIKSNKDYLKVADDSDTLSDRVLYLAPYAQTTALINECVTLNMKVNSGLLKLEEMSGRRKDRFSSLAYANYFASLLDKNIMMQTSESNFDDLLQLIYF